jgi:hypothetical protein
LVPDAFDTESSVECGKRGTETHEVVPPETRQEVDVEGLPTCTVLLGADPTDKDIVDVKLCEHVDDALRVERRAVPLHARPLFAGAALGRPLPVIAVGRAPTDLLLCHLGPERGNERAGLVRGVEPRSIAQDRHIVCARVGVALDGFHVDDRQLRQRNLLHPTQCIERADCADQARTLGWHAGFRRVRVDRTASIDDRARTPRGPDVTSMATSQWGAATEVAGST